MGYRLLNDGKAFRDDLDWETFSLSLNGLEEGLSQRTMFYYFTVCKIKYLTTMKLTSARS